jgi:hypothetical protein
VLDAWLGDSNAAGAFYLVTRARDTVARSSPVGLRVRRTWHLVDRGPASVLIVSLFSRPTRTDATSPPPSSLARRVSALTIRTSPTGHVE